MTVRSRLLSTLDSPVGRVVGAVVSWTAFAFFFGGLFQAASAVMSQGGFCASGGPYVIDPEHVCSDAVVLFAPLGIFGMFVAVGVALLAARGFGVPLVAWGWTILFGGLGIQFLASATEGQGIVVNLVVGILFVVMGAAPVVLVVRSGELAAMLRGARSLGGARFERAGDPPRYLGLPGATTGATVEPAAGDWALSLGLWLVSIVIGGSLSVAAFAAVAASGAPAP